MNVIKTEIKRAVVSREFMMAAAGMVIAIILGSFNTLKSFKVENVSLGFHMHLLLTALSSDVMLLVVPILSALPYTAAFVDDCSSGYITQCLPRSGRGPYIQGKLMACGLSGGMALFCGIMVAYVLSALVFMPMEPLPPLDTPQPSLGMELFGKAFIFFLSGTLWSLVGLALSTLTMSKYVSYASPFIIYYGLVITSTRYIKGLYCINPQEWLNPQNFWPGDHWGIILFLIELIVITGLFFRIVALRRIGHE